MSELSQRDQSDFRAMVNAARDVADSFHRFDRDWRRFFEMVRDNDRRDVEAAMMEACAGSKRRLNAMEVINERLAALEESRS